MHYGGSGQGSLGQVGLSIPAAAVQPAAADLAVPFAAAAYSAEHSMQYSLGCSCPSGFSFLSAALPTAPFPAPVSSGVASDDGGGAGHTVAAADRRVLSTQVLASCCTT